MSEDMDFRVTDAELRAGPVISAIENLANNRVREHDLEHLAKADDDDLRREA
jgi:hypothetical protein